MRESQGFNEKLHAEKHLCVTGKPKGTLLNHEVWNLLEKPSCPVKRLEGQSCRALIQPRIAGGCCDIRDLQGPMWEHILGRADD